MRIQTQYKQNTNRIPTGVGKLMETGNQVETAEAAAPAAPTPEASAPQLFGATRHHITALSAGTQRKQKKT